jgi:hypothetical protein
MHDGTVRFLLTMLLIAAPLRGGVVYDFVTTIETPRFSSRQTGRIAVEGRSYRADFDGRGSRDIDMVISRDGDQTAVYVDLRRCSWWYRNRIGPIRSSRFFHLPTDGADAVTGEPVVEHHIEGVETIAGFAATRHVIDIRYRLVGVMADTAVRGSVVARATIWTVDTLPPLPMRRDLRTGHPTIDEKLAGVSGSLHGMIVRHELEVSRNFDDGLPQTERTITTVSNLRVAELPDSLFAVPEEAAYVQRAPGS